MDGTSEPSVRAPFLAFDPAQHRDALLALVREVAALVIAAIERGERGSLPEPVLRGVLRRHPKDGRGFFSRGDLIAGFRAFSAELGVTLDEGAFIERVQMRPVRTHSGVTPVTVLTKPYPCPGKCVFCPSDVRMPKSYLSREPGCQRAEQNGFDPYLQTYNRLRAFRAMGHAQAKAELIVLGGTFSFYPEAYQRWFVTRCFHALNDVGRGHDGRAQAGGARVDHHALPAQVDGRAGAAQYNRTLLPFLAQQHEGALLAPSEQASWAELQAAQRGNERSACRNVGLVIETRPDHVDEAELLRLRRLGCTKVQLGYQSLSDDVLAQNQRGHDLAATRRAMQLLRAAGFKVQAHVMLNLLGSTPERDVADYRRAFDDPDFRPDELKVYPCSLIESAELMRFYESGAWRPYTHAELLAVLSSVIALTPRYARLSRVIRDISSGDIVTGNRLSNFRELAEAALQDTGRRPEEIRSREIKRAPFDPAALELRVTPYATSVGEERFLELCTPEDRVVAFLRLSLPAQPSFVPELGRSAVIRELHVYGAALALGARDAAGAQHRGLGARLVTEAASRARAAGHLALSVISAVGTRAYYRRLGFQDGELYQHMPL
jgi:elongator complex protein 3